MKSLLGIAMQSAHQVIHSEIRNDHAKECQNDVNMIDSLTLILHCALMLMLMGAM